MSRCVRKGLRCSAALAVVVLGAVGCGIPTDDGPRAISRENLPDDAADDTSEATATQPTVAAQVYLVQSPDDEPRLVAVDRRVPADDPAADPEPAAVLETLLRTTANAREQADGITNLIPEDLRLASQPELARGTLVVDLTRAIFDDVEGENQRAAFGQIVCTADALEGVSGVRFQVDGEPRDAQVDRGTTGGPVTCADDYQRLQGPPD
ncbi:MAG: GerMN domain-containing protein [Acidimicrobiales bacterium]